MFLALPLAKLTRELRSGPPLKLAVVFGPLLRAAVHGTPLPDATLEVGILPAHPELAPSEEVRLRRLLERATGYCVELVRLDNATGPALAEIARDGRLVMESVPGEWACFRAGALHKWLDFATVFERTAERVRQSLIAPNATPA